MNFKNTEDERIYFEKIEEKLVTKYKLEKIDAQKKLEEYEYLNDIIEFDLDFFYYHSPEYWADYLMD